VAKFDRIKSYNKKYTAELEQALRIIMPTLIEAYVRIFGEKHRAYITYTLTHLNFVFFIPSEYLFYPLHCPKFSEEYKVGQDYQKYLDYLKLKLKNISESEKDKFRLKNYITKSDLLGPVLEHQISPFIEEDSALFMPILSADNGTIISEKVILLPIFVIDLKTIIHELTHALCINALFLTEDRIITLHGFPNYEVMELINDFIATKVLEEYVRLGGVVPDSLKRFTLLQAYEKKSYLIEYFYNFLSPLINEALISGNHNLLERCLNPALFTRFCDTVKHLYHKKSILDNELEYLKSLVDQMVNFYFIPKKEDFNAFYEYLESIGYKVRRL